MMHENSNTRAVYDYIKENGSITSYEAFRELGVTRLSAVIWCLKKQGYKVTSTDESVRARTGKTVTFSRYSIEEDV